MTLEPSTALHLWPVFSVKMVADLDGAQHGEVKARLDRMVDQGILRRWTQERPEAPDVYYLAPTV